jgi:hypothetical protein
MERRTILGLSLWGMMFWMLSTLDRAIGQNMRLRFSELYKAFGVLGLEFSDKVRQLSGKPIIMRGFMAPPLKPHANFFVLTKQPVSICPFCQSDADWPNDIVLVYTREPVEHVPPSKPVEVEGILEVGSKVDLNTGFVSLLRIVDATVAIL